MPCRALPCPSLSHTPRLLLLLLLLVCRRMWVSSRAAAVATTTLLIQWDAVCCCCCCCCCCSFYIPRSTHWFHHRADGQAGGWSPTFSALSPECFTIAAVVVTCEWVESSGIESVGYIFSHAAIVAGEGGGGGRNRQVKAARASTDIILAHIYIWTIAQLYVLQISRWLELRIARLFLNWQAKAEIN